MNRPYTICHIFSALDGAITGSFMSMPQTAAARMQYGNLRSVFNSNAILYGTTTMLDFCDGIVQELPESAPIERTDYISPDAKDRFVVAIDRHGKLSYGTNYLDRHGVRSHIIEVLTDSVSDAYIQYLRQKRISYLFAGKTELDCELAMVKLKSLFGIERLIIAGGGYIDWAFADAGMIDELSLVLAPGADGEQNVTVFERTDHSQNRAIAFTLLEVKPLVGNAVWLRYAFDNAKE